MSSLTAQNYTDNIVNNSRCAVDAIDQLARRVGCFSSRRNEINYAIFHILRNETKRYMKELSDTELANMYRVCKEAAEEEEEDIRDITGFDGTYIPEKYLSADLVIYYQVERTMSKRPGFQEESHVGVCDDLPGEIRD